MIGYDSEVDGLIASIVYIFKIKVIQDKLLFNFKSIKKIALMIRDVTEHLTGTLLLYTTLYFKGVR